MNKVPKLSPQDYHILPSTIPGAGYGLFAARDLPADHGMGFYQGLVRFPDEFLAAVTRGETNGDYTWAIKDFVGNPMRPPGTRYEKDKYVFYVDAADLNHGNYLRYVNHAPTRKHLNVYVKQLGPQIHYFTNRQINRGEELFVNYGNNYSKKLIGYSFT